MTKRGSLWIVLAFAALLLVWGQRSMADERSKQTNTPVTTAIYLPVVWGGGAAQPTHSATPFPTATLTPTPDWVTILEEGFERDFPAGWEVFDNADGHGEYYWAKRDCRAYEGRYSAWAVGGGADGAALPCLSEYPNLAQSWMVYGPFSLEAATAAELSAMLWLNTPQNQDSLSLCASKDNGYFGCLLVSGALAAWQEHKLDLMHVPTLGSLLGEPRVWVALIFTSDAHSRLFEGAYADRIVLRQRAH